MPEIMKSYGYEWENDGHSIGRAHLDSKDFPKEMQDNIAEAKKVYDDISKKNEAQFALNQKYVRDGLDLQKRIETASDYHESLQQDNESLKQKNNVLKKTVKRNADFISRQVGLSKDLGLNIGPKMADAVQERMEEMKRDSEELER